MWDSYGLKSRLSRSGQLLTMLDDREDLSERFLLRRQRQSQDRHCDRSGAVVADTRRDIIIESTTGQFIGERELILNGVASVPANTIMASTAVTTTIVDAAPMDTAVCGNHR